MGNLHKAAARGNTERFKHILNKKGLNGLKEISELNFAPHYNPLELACLMGKTEIVKIILEYPGVDAEYINNATRFGMTPLHFAASFGDIEMVNLLLNKGASISKTNHKNMNALFNAAMEGNTEICKLLLKNSSIDLANHIDNEGKRAIDYVKQYNHENTYLLLKLYDFAQNFPEKSEFLNKLLDEKSHYDFAKIRELSEITGEGYVSAENQRRINAIICEMSKSI